MDLPFFSIVIPTRNRYETLRYSILTVLHQTFDSFELIISDNSDPANYSGGLELLGEQLKDERVLYFRPPAVLAMADNWEFAVSKARGEYIIIFGDDDGLVVDSLTRIHEIIQKTKSDLVSWARVEYNWPDFAPAALANRLVIPFAAETGLVNGRKYINKVISFKADYRYLPMFYNSAVNKRMVNLLKEKTGRVFNASSPDVYTGYAFAHLIKNYITVGFPLSINGVSGKSNGAAYLYENDSLMADYWKLQKGSAIKWPALLPEISTPYIAIVEPFIQLRNFFPELNNYLSWKKIYKIIIDSFESKSEEEAEKKLEKILDRAKSDKSLHGWLIRYAKRTSRKITSGGISQQENKTGFHGSHLVLDGSKFQLKNVQDVSEFIYALFGNLKNEDFLRPANPSLFRRMKKAAAIVLRGV